jgi:hypothetical protein
MVETEDEKALEEAKRVMARLVKMPPKQHDEMKVGRKSEVTARARPHRTGSAQAKRPSRKHSPKS